MADCFFNYTSATELVTYSTNIGDGINSVFVVPHNLGTKDVSVTVRDTQTNLLAYPAIEVITLSSVSVSFSFVPALTAYDVTIFAAASGLRVEPFSDRVVINIDEQPPQNVTVSISSVGENITINAAEFLAQWGSIIGTLSAQTDLWVYLSAVGTSNFDIPTLTNYLSTNCILLSCLNVNGQILSAGVPLHDIFLTSETDSQTLSYTTSSYLLSISNGNTVNLSSINSVFAANSGKYESVYSNVVSNSADWNSAYNISTAYQGASSSFATNTALNAASSILLPTSVYQGASANWQSTYLTAITSINNFTGKDVTLNNYIYFTTSQNVSSNRKYAFDTTTNILTATLPPNPSIGDEIEFFDISGTWHTTPLVIARNTKTIEQKLDNLNCNVRFGLIKLIYTNNVGWRIIPQPKHNVPLLVAPSVAINTNTLSGTIPFTVSFSGVRLLLNSIGPVDSWYWDLSGNSNIDATGQFATFTYNTSGTYTVTLTGQNDIGIGTASVSITAITATVTPVITSLSADPFSDYVTLLLNFNT